MSRKMVVPGELVTEERKRLGKHVYLREGKIYSDSVGVVQEDTSTASVVPLQGKYIPEEEDIVIGIITGEKFAGYMADINSFYPSFILRKDLRESLQNFSVVSAKVMKINEVNEVNLGYVRVLHGGAVLSVTPVKVPRIIGKDGSMLAVLKKGTDSMLVVGRNGRVWAKGGNIKLLSEALELIQREAHMENLTNRVTDFLEKKNAKGE